MIHLGTEHFVTHDELPTVPAPIAVVLMLLDKVGLALFPFLLLAKPFLNVQRNSSLKKVRGTECSDRYHCGMATEDMALNGKEFKAL